MLNIASRVLPNKKRYFGGGPIRRKGGGNWVLIEYRQRSHFLFPLGNRILFSTRGASVLKVTLLNGEFFFGRWEIITRQSLRKALGVGKNQLSIITNYYAQ